MAGAPSTCHSNERDFHDKLKLFRASDGTWITSATLSRAIKETGAVDCDILYIHSGLNLGVPNPELDRHTILQSLFEVIMSLGVPTICMPQIYPRSVSAMGMQTHCPDIEQPNGRAE